MEEFTNILPGKFKNTPVDNFNFNFIPVGFVSGVSPCDDLFVGTPAHNFSMSSEYQLKSGAFIKKTEQLIRLDKSGMEGHSHQMELQYR